MLYAIVGEDAPDCLVLRKKVRAAHLARVQELADQGRIHLAGPFPAIDSPDPGEAGFIGSLIVAEFPSLEEAEAWIQDDPYVTEGVFQSLTVKPFKKIFP